MQHSLLRSNQKVWSENLRLSFTTSSTPTNLHRDRIAAPLSQKRTPRPRNSSFALMPKRCDFVAEPLPLLLRFVCVCVCVYCVLCVCVLCVCVCV